MTDRRAGGSKDQATNQPKDRSREVTIPIILSDLGLIKYIMWKTKIKHENHFVNCCVASGAKEKHYLREMKLSLCVYDTLNINYLM